MLFQEINGANADNTAPSKPERDHWAIFLVKVHQELVQTSASNDIRQIAVPEEHKEVTWARAAHSAEAERDQGAEGKHLLLVSRS